VSELVLLTEARCIDDRQVVQRRVTAECVFYVGRRRLNTDLQSDKQSLTTTVKAEQYQVDTLQHHSIMRLS